MFSNTNPSRLSFEMVASGLNVIEYKSEFTDYDLPNQIFTKIKDSNNILNIVNNLFVKNIETKDFINKITSVNEKNNFINYINNIIG